MKRCSGIRFRNYESTLIGTKIFVFVYKYEYEYIARILVQSTKLVLVPVLQVQVLVQTTTTISCDRMRRRILQHYLFSTTSSTTTFIFKQNRQLLPLLLQSHQQQHYSYQNIVVMKKGKRNSIMKNNNENGMESINNITKKRLKSDTTAATTTTTTTTTSTNSNNNSSNNNSNTSTTIEKCLSNYNNTTIDNDIDSILDKLFDEYYTVNTGNVTMNTITKSSWCLRTGLKHIVSVDIDWNNRKQKQKQKQQKTSKSSDTSTIEEEPIRMINLIQQHGLPNFYSCLSSSSNTTMKCQNRHNATQDIKDPTSCFESLCRIIIGQMVSTKAAQVIWYRFVTYIIDQSNTGIHNASNTYTSQDAKSSVGKMPKVLFTPEQVLSIVQVQQKNNSSNTDTAGCSTGNAYNYDEQSIVELLQKPVGLTKNKAKSIIDLAYHFVSGQLSEDLFLKKMNATSVDESKSNNNDDKLIKTKLLAVKGIGQWTYEIFIMFFVEQSNILPLGDLGIRKGISLYCPNYNFFNTTKNNKSKNIKDIELIKGRTLLQCYEPYQSLFTYYMWRLVETKSSTSTSTNKSNSTTTTTTTTSTGSRTKK